MQLFVTGFDNESHYVECDRAATVNDFAFAVSKTISVPVSQFVLSKLGCSEPIQITGCSGRSEFLATYLDGAEWGFFQVELQLQGGIDFQHREGSKIGSGGHLSESQAALERKERLRKLALETIDITKDPYIIKNNLGTFECKLCLTVHPNEGNYLAHTQGKRHQYNLGRRAAMEAKNAGPRVVTTAKEAPKRTVLRIGRPGYKVTKSRDLRTMQRALTFEVEYPECEAGCQPRHRFMSAFEQKVEAPDKNFQYVLFACDPYETIAFKIPNHPIDRREGRFFTNWDQAANKFVLQLHFQPDSRVGGNSGSAGAAIASGSDANEGVYA